ncbi:heavy-metal-associated domain-containing protein [Bordetella genomosp. 2]|uniref:HMA domain-containing protein n=1 Tax=Bordetella genomosp. 2 TaxID=1983456 RepID=A0A261VFV3_9BORD|nr:heavy-metal-associated domain-containing protein [Bordetella genomosp. 2]OZI72651.1 hypothetical protein CAL24_20425 [Bordetella genomosp. 2]
MQFHLDDMTCGGCARTVTKAIQLLDPDASVVTDPPARLVKVQTSASEAEVVAALREAGFPPARAITGHSAGPDTGRPQGPPLPAGASAWGR